MPNQIVATINALIANANGGDGTDIGAYKVQPATLSYAAQIQLPINADGTSVFNSRRGVVPVKFNLTLGGAATCDLPPATIAVTRTGGGVTGEVTNPFTATMQTQARTSGSTTASTFTTSTQGHFELASTA